MTDRVDVQRKQFRADFLTRLTIYLVCLLVILLLGFISYDTWLANQQRDAVLSCTNPNGSCFRRSEKRIQKAVTSVIREQQASARGTKEVIIYASYCAKLSENQTVKGVEKCVKSLLGSTPKLGKR